MWPYIAINVNEATNSFFTSVDKGAEDDGLLQLLSLAP